MENLNSGNNTEINIFAELNIAPEKLKPFSQELILCAYPLQKGNTESLIEFLNRPEHIQALNDLKNDEINSIKAIMQTEPKQGLEDNFLAMESIQKPMDVALALLGYELNCFGCGSYFIDEEAIGFKLPIDEINKALESEAPVEEVENLIPSMVCPKCESVNKMTYLFDMKF